MSSTLVDEIKKVIADADDIKSADGYDLRDVDRAVIHGGTYDSSYRKNSKGAFILEAEKEFIKSHQREILDLAAEKCKASIGDISSLFKPINEA